MVAFNSQYNSYNPYQAQQHPYNPYQQQQPYSDPNTPRQQFLGQFMQQLAYQPFGMQQHSYNPYQQQYSPFSPYQQTPFLHDPSWQPQKQGKLMAGLLSEEKIKTMIEEDRLDNGVVDSSTFEQKDIKDNGFLDLSINLPSSTHLETQKYAKQVSFMNKLAFQSAILNDTLENNAEVKQDPEAIDELKNMIHTIDSRYSVVGDMLSGNLFMDKFMFENRNNPFIGELARTDEQRRYIDANYIDKLIFLAEVEGADIQLYQDTQVSEDERVQYDNQLDSIGERVSQALNQLNPVTRMMTYQTKKMAEFINPELNQDFRTTMQELYPDLHMNMINKIEKDNGFK